jgi:hypothetical protein
VGFLYGGTIIVKYVLHEGPFVFGLGDRGKQSDLVNKLSSYMHPSIISEGPKFAEGII